MLLPDLAKAPLIDEML